MGKIIGRILRILAWIMPFYQFRASLWRRSGVIIGHGVYIGNLTYIDGEYPHLVQIDDWVSIGPHAIILAHSGGSPYHHRTEIFHQKPQPVHLKRGAWIASGAIILPGVTIGEGSIIAAGSVVSKDIPDFVIAAGNPARVVKKLKQVKK
jgi:acetyltransferase-like isoleucine patch superfamily enzyme